LQYFVENKPLRLEEVLIGTAAGRHAPVSDLFVKAGKSEQGVECLLPRHGFENAIAFLQRRGGIGRHRRVAVKSGWIGTHAGSRYLEKPLLIVSGATWKFIAVLGSTRLGRQNRTLRAALAPPPTVHNQYFEVSA